jgi:hypothetical protein
MPEATMFYNKDYKTMQFCDGSVWYDMKADGTFAVPCGGIGGICQDGSIFAGWTYDGHMPLYTMPADSGVFAWGPATDTAIVNCLSGTENSCYKGKENTQIIASLAGPYNAAKNCASLSVYGHDDWYLPSILELQTLYSNFGMIGGFVLGQSYWSSSETISGSAGAIIFQGGILDNAAKTESYYVRCVRR